MHGRRHRIIVVALAAAIALGSCGGRLSKQEFVAQADEKCERANRRMRNLDIPSDAAGLRTFVDDARAVIDRLVDELRELEPPEPDEQRTEAMIADLEEVSSSLPDLAEATNSGDPQRIQEVSRKLLGAAADANKAAKDLGLETCSTGPISQVGE